MAHFVLLAYFHSWSSFCIIHALALLNKSIQHCETVEEKKENVMSLKA